MRLVLLCKLRKLRPVLSVWSLNHQNNRRSQTATPFPGSKPQGPVGTSPCGTRSPCTSYYVSWRPEVHAPLRQTRDTPCAATRLRLLYQELFSKSCCPGPTRSRGRARKISPAACP